MAKSRPPVARNRSLLYPQERTFRGPRWTSGFDPQETCGASELHLCQLHANLPGRAPEPGRSIPLAGLKPALQLPGTNNAIAPTPVLGFLRGRATTGIFYPACEEATYAAFPPAHGTLHFREAGKIFEQAQVLLSRYCGYIYRFHHILTYLAGHAIRSN